MGCCLGKQDGFEQAYGPDENPDPNPEEQRLPAPYEAPGVHSKKEPVAPVSLSGHGSPQRRFLHNCKLNNSSCTHAFAASLACFPRADWSLCWPTYLHSFQQVMHVCFHAFKECEEGLFCCLQGLQDSLQEPEPLQSRSRTPSCWWGRA